MKEKLKDIAIRAGKTFWQAGLAYLLINAQAIIESLGTLDANTLKEILPTLAVGALAAGCSAVYNGLVKPAIEKYLAWYEQKQAGKLAETYDGGANDEGA